MVWASSNRKCVTVILDKSVNMSLYFQIFVIINCHWNWMDLVLKWVELDETAFDWLKIKMTKR